MTRFIDITYTGNRRDFATTFGRLKKGREVRMALPAAEAILRLSDEFDIGNSIWDEEGNMVEEYRPTSVGSLAIKQERDFKNGMKIAFAREYAWGDMIMAAMFACRSAKLQNPKNFIAFYVPARFIDFFKMFDFIDTVGQYPPNFTRRQDFDRYIDLTRIPEFHARHKGFSRMEIFASVVEKPVYEFKKFIPPISYINAAKREIEIRNEQERKVVGISVTSNSQVRTYPPEHFRSLVNSLLKQFFVVVLGTDNFGWGLSRWNGKNLYSVVDKTDDLRELAGYAASLDYGICTDQGMLHLMGIMKIPTLGIFGNMDPSFRIKYYPSVTAVFPRGELSCIPCNDKFNPCPRTIEKFGGACLGFLTPEKVMKNFVETVVKSTEVNDDVFRRISKMYSVTKKQIISRHYPYALCKTPIKEHPKYRVMFVVPHIFMGGGETQLMYLIQNLPSIEFEMKLAIIGTVDSELYPKISRMISTVVIGSRQNKEELLRLKIREFDPDVIIFHGTDFLSRAMRGLQKKPAIIQILHTGIGPWTEDVLRASVDLNDRAIGVAEWIRMKFQKKYPGVRVSTVLNGVPCLDYSGSESLRKKFKISPKDFVVGCMSRFGGEKRLNLLIEALKQLPAHVKILLAGWGDRELELRELANTVERSRVIFAGVVHDRAAFFKTVDCVALVSVAEGNSMFLLEAAMAEKPIITTKVGASPELFADFQSAIFVDGKADTIAGAVSQLMESPELQSRLGQNAKALVYRNCSDTVMAQGYRIIIQDEIRRRIYPQKIFCFRPGGLGDLLMAIPAIRSLRNNYPDAIIEFMTSPEYADILQDNALIDRLIRNRNRQSFYKISQKYDVAIHFEHWEVWDTHEHIITHYLRLVGADNVKDFDLSINLEGVATPKIPTPYVTVHTKCKFACKNWGRLDQWGKIIKFLKSKFHVVQIGGSEEPNLGEIYLPSEKLSARQTIAVQKGAMFHVGIDSFPIHGAKSANIPSVAIYGGSSDPDFCGYQSNFNVVSPCACTCDLSKTTTKKCERGLLCLKSIDEDNVVDAIISLMEKRKI